MLVSTPPNFIRTWTLKSEECLNQQIVSARPVSCETVVSMIYYSLFSVPRTWLTCTGLNLQYLLCGVFLAFSVNYPEFNTGDETACCVYLLIAFKTWLLEVVNGGQRLLHQTPILLLFLPLDLVYDNFNLITFVTDNGIVKTNWSATQLFDYITKLCTPHLKLACNHTSVWLRLSSLCSGVILQ